MSPVFEKKESKLEYWFTIFALISMSGALVPLFGEQRLALDSDSNTKRMLTNTAIFLLAGGIATYRWGVTSILLSRNLLVGVLFLLPLVSMVWSVDPGVTFRRAAAHLLTGLFCIYIAGRMTPEELMRRLTLAFFVGGVASLGYIAIGMGVHVGGSLLGAWKGVYGQKNELGRIASLAIIVATFMIPTNGTQRLIRLGTIGIFALMVVMCQSRTNWFTLAVMLAFIPMTDFLRNQKVALSLRVSLTAFAVLFMVFVAAVGAPAILAASGRDMSFSGRETLWHGVNNIIQTQFPYLGAGYGGFFTEKGASYELRPYIMHWRGVPSHAHNGYINTRADLGIPGLIALAVFMFILGARLLGRILNEHQRKVWTVFGAILVLFLINNFSESVAFKHSDIAWILVMIAYIYAAPTSKAVRRLPVLRAPSPGGSGAVARESQ
jgi:O-antigen ligase